MINLVYFLFVLLAVPVGYLIAYLARDELVEGRKWFKGLIVLFLIVILFSLMFGDYLIVLTSLFVIIVSWISIVKGKDRKWISARGEK